MKRQAVDRLGEIALSQGEAFIGGGNRPVRLSDPEMLWYVVKGAIDVFVAQRSEDETESDFRQVLRAVPGRLIFSVAGEEGGASAVYIAKGLPDTELRSVPRSAFAAPEVAGLLVRQVDAWIADFAATIAHDVEPRPRPERFLAPGEEAGNVEESVLTTRHGVVWVSAPEGDAAFLDTGEPDGDGPGLIPVTIDSWSQAVPSLPADRHLVRGALRRRPAVRRAGRVPPAGAVRRGAQPAPDAGRHDQPATRPGPAPPPQRGVRPPQPVRRPGPPAAVPCRRRRIGAAERPRDGRPPRGDPVPLSAPPPGNGGEAPRSGGDPARLGDPCPQDPARRRRPVVARRQRSAAGVPSRVRGRRLQEAGGAGAGRIGTLPHDRPGDGPFGAGGRASRPHPRRRGALLLPPAAAGRSGRLRHPVPFRVPRARNRPRALHRGRAAGRPPDAGASDPARPARGPRHPERVRPAATGAVPVPGPAGGPRRHLASPPGDGPDAAGGPGRRPGGRGALGPDARPAAAVLPPLLLRRSDHAGHGRAATARPGLGGGRQRGAVGDLPPADVRPAVPLRHHDRLARPGPGPVLSGVDDGHRPPPASPLPAPVRDLTALGGQAPAIAQRCRQAAGDRVGRHRVRHVGEGLPGAETDRDAARPAERAPDRLPHRRPLPGDGRGVHVRDGRRRRGHFPPGTSSPSTRP